MPRVVILGAQIPSAMALSLLWLSSQSLVVSRTASPGAALAWSCEGHEWGKHLRLAPGSLSTSPCFLGKTYFICFDVQRLRGGGFCFIYLFTLFFLPEGTAVFRQFRHRKWESNFFLNPVVFFFFLNDVCELQEGSCSALHLLI